MAIDAFQPDRPVSDGGIELGGRREAAQLPAFLIPAAPDDPFALRIGAGIGRNLRLCIGKARRAREVERHQLEAKAHHMAVRIDEAGQQRPPLPVEPIVEGFGRGLLVLLLLFGVAQRLVGADQADNLAIGADDHAGEADDLSLAVEREAVDVLDERVRERGGRGDGGKERDCAEEAPHFAFRRRISALVS